MIEHDGHPAAARPMLFVAACATVLVLGLPLSFGRVGRVLPERVLIVAAVAALAIAALGGSSARRWTNAALVLLAATAALAMRGIEPAGAIALAIAAAAVVRARRLMTPATADRLRR